MVADGYVTKYKRLALPVVAMGSLSCGVKNEGFSHYVVENKYSKNVGFGSSHYVYDSQCCYTKLAITFMKTQVVRLQPRVRTECSRRFLLASVASGAARAEARSEGLAHASSMFQGQRMESKQRSAREPLPTPISRLLHSEIKVHPEMLMKTKGG
jgi:hypothetical protein